MPWENTMKISTIYLLQRSGHSMCIQLSNLAMTRLANEGVNLIPMAVPDAQWQMFALEIKITVL